MTSFKVPGLFDAIYAAAGLNQDEERKILSTVDVYDRVAGRAGVGPRAFKP